MLAKKGSSLNLQGICKRPFLNKFQRKTKGQQLKGKIVSEFSHFFTLFQNFSPSAFPFKT